MTLGQTPPLSPRLGAPPPKISDDLVPLLLAEAPRFSQGEMQRRRTAFDGMLEKAGADHALLIGQDRVRGSALQWLTGWPSNAKNTGVASRGRKDALFVPHPNHVPQAAVLAPDAEVVWTKAGPEALAIAELEARGAKGKTVGVIGPIGVGFYGWLVEAGFRLVDLTRAFTGLRAIKSDEEMQWVRIAAALSDLAVEALARDLEIGMTEHELGALIERAYQPWGGQTQIHFLGLTSMASPDCCVPSQIPRDRLVTSGDVVFTEISVSFWSYSGQVLRTFAVDAEPSPLYRDLYNAADEAFNSVLKVLKAGSRPADVLQAANCIDAAGFTVCDDFLHGFVGGYLSPVLGTYQRPSGPVPDMVFEENMCVVVQPSVIPKDGTPAGVQVGELVRITRDGVERVHQTAWGFQKVG